MCGLIALLDTTLVPDAEQASQRGLLALAHRGLPDRSTWRRVGERVILGHVRLPIVGLSRKYDQPFVANNGRATVFVGEIFSHRVQWPRWPENDAFAVHQMFEAEGVDLYSRQDGFWSAVHVDKRGEQADVVVDYLAQKPLYFHRQALVVASEPRAIIAVLGRQPLDPLYLSNVRKWGYDPLGRTPWSTIEKIRPGTSLTVRTLGPTVREKVYYPLLPSPGPALEADLETSVWRRMVADVPVAVLCSGGLDSTLVAMMAAETSEEVHVFHAENDEAQYLEDLHWPTSVKSVRKIELDGFIEEAARKAYHEPVDLGSVVPQYALGRAVHEADFRVALSGDGADELFGGYGRAHEYDSQASDVWCELVHYHLPRLDRCMMASAVELRTPFLAPSVVRQALALPREERTGKGVIKAIARRRGVPASIVDREKKPLRTRQVSVGGLELRYHLVDEFVRMEGLG